MPYGIPCPEDLAPDDVYAGNAQLDTAIADFVGAVMREIDCRMTECCAPLDTIIGKLKSYVRRQLSQLNKILDQIVHLLISQISGSSFQLDVQLSSVVQDIATYYGISTTEVISAPYPLPYLPAPYPPSTLPTAPGAPFPAPPSFPPGTSPFAPSPFPVSPALAPVNRPVVVGGEPVVMTQVCAPIPSGPSVNVGGFVYAPTVLLLSGGGPLPTGPGGTPSIPISYDPQPDGSIAVHIGNVSVVIRLTPDPSNPDAPACALGPS